MSSTEITSKAELDQQLIDAGDKLFIVDFYADWCGPCRSIAPKFDELAETFQGQVVVAKVDVDECHELAEEYEVSALPTFSLFKNGKKVFEVVGASPEKLMEAIHQHK